MSRVELRTDDFEHERPLFEAWYSEGGKFPRATERGSGGEYLLQQAHTSWIVWKARAALSAPPAAGVLEGWKLVPIKPTAEMKAACRVAGKTKVWADMLAAAPTPPASEQQQTVQQPHTVEFVGKTCQRVLMAEGKPYPRTCAVCGLSGPCKSFPRENDQRLNPHLAKGEGV